MKTQNQENKKENREEWKKIRMNSELAEIVERYSDFVRFENKEQSQKAADDLATFILQERQKAVEERDKWWIKKIKEYHKEYLFDAMRWNMFAREMPDLAKENYPTS